MSSFWRFFTGEEPEGPPAPPAREEALKRKLAEHEARIAELEREIAWRRHAIAHIEGELAGDDDPS